MRGWGIGIAMIVALALAGALYMQAEPQRLRASSAPLASAAPAAAAEAASRPTSLGAQDTPGARGSDAAFPPASNPTGAVAAAGIGPEPRYFKGPYANGNVLEEIMGSDAFEADMAALADAMSRDPDAAAFGELQRQRLKDTMARAGLDTRDVRIACGLRACLLQFTHGDEGRLAAWWSHFDALPPPRAGVAMSQPLQLDEGRWMQRVFLSFDPTVHGISSRPTQTHPKQVRSVPVLIDRRTAPLDRTSTTTLPSSRKRRLAATWNKRRRKNESHSADQGLSMVAYSSEGCA